MVIREDLLAKLRQVFGLNLYEVRIWVALLSRGNSTAGELSNIANVPRSRAYDILESLEKKGFIMMKIGKPIQYMAIPPSEIIDRVKRNVRKEAIDKEKRLDRLKKAEELKELDLLFRKGVELIDPTEMSGVLKGRDNIYSKLEAMINKSQKEVSLVTSPAGAIRKVDVLKRAMEKAKKRGVAIRLATSKTKDNKAALNTARKFASIKPTGNVDARFAIVDNKQVLFMLLPDHEVHPKYDVGIWVQSELFAKALNTMFNKISK